MDEGAGLLRLALAQQSGKCNQIESALDFVAAQVVQIFRPVGDGRANTDSRAVTGCFNKLGDSRRGAAIWVREATHRGVK